MQEISSYRDNKPTHDKHTNPQTHKHKDRIDYNTLRRSLARNVTRMTLRCVA